ncbi:hypothetical protein KAX17_03405 [Candidatus Bipolaricaulota bacterium]|nr:hypothetical protein [Candidatus Bipolaricaulota bacterium]
MIETAVIKLLDLLAQHWQGRKARSRSEFHSFVQPLYDQFQVINQNYLDCFRRYRTLLKDPSIALDETHPVFDAINEDHVFSADTRRRLDAAAEVVKGDERTVRFFEDGDDVLTVPELDDLGLMLWFMHRYVSGADRCIYYDDLSFISNFPRSSLYSGLRFLVSAEPERIRSVEIGAEQNCFDYVMDKSPPPVVRIPGERGWSLVMKILSQAQWDNLRSLLAQADGNTDGMRRALALCLVDKIVARNQMLFGLISECFERVKADRLRDRGTRSVFRFFRPRR